MLRGKSYWSGGLMNHQMPLTQPLIFCDHWQSGTTLGMERTQEWVKGRKRKFRSLMDFKFPPMEHRRVEAVGDNRRGRLWLERKGFFCFFFGEKKEKQDFSLPIRAYEWNVFSWACVQKATSPQPRLVAIQFNVPHPEQSIWWCLWWISHAKQRLFS